MGLMALWMVAAGCRTESAIEPPDLDPQTARLVAEMRARYAAGDWNAALALSDSAAAAAGELKIAVVPFTRGLIFTRLRQYDRAEQAYRRALEIDPTYRQIWFNLGHNALLQRRYRDALKHYEKERALIEGADSHDRMRYATQDRRGLPAVHAQIGRTYDLLGVQDSARLAYERSLAADSTYPVAHAWLSDHFEKAGRTEQALHHARRALANSPQTTEYAYQVGSLLVQTGRTAEAVPILAMVTRKWPGHEGATYNLGRALLAQGREKEGQAALARLDEIKALQEDALQAQRAVATYPEDPQRWVTLGGLMLKSGYFDKAEQALSAALVRDPDNLTLQNDLANLALVRGDTTLAIHRFQKLLVQDSTFSDAWLNLGIIYVMKERPEDARHAWQQVLRYSPGDADARAYLDRLN